MNGVIIFNKKNSNSIILHIVALVLIYISGAAITSIDAGIYIGLTLNIVIYLFGFYCIIEQFSNAKIDVKALILLSMTILFGIVCYINYMPSAIKVFKRLVLFVIFFFMARYIEKKNVLFEQCLYDTIVILAYIALILFIITNVFRIDLPHGILAQGTNSIHIYNNYFYVFFTGSNYFTGNIFGYPFYRLQGIFWEPGVFSVYLNLALFYYFFCLEKKRKLHIVILLLDIFLTMSTTGLCVAAVLVGTYMIHMIEGVQFKFIALGPMVIIVVIAVAAIWLQKKNLSDNAWSSYALRINDLINSLKLWRNHFWLGTGFNNTNMFQGTIENRGNSNGLLTWCYTTGLIGAIAIFYPMIGNIFRGKRKRIIYALFLFIFIAVNMTEPLIHSYFMLYLIARSYSMFLYRNGGRINGFVKSENCSYST